MPATNPTESAAGRKVGLFDLRYILAVLFGIYGLAVMIMGLAGASSADAAKSGGINVNLWSGVVMLAVAIVFALWAALRPIRIAPPEDETPPARETTPI